MKRIGLIGAMDVEVEIIKKEMEIERTEERAGLSFCIGRWQGREIVVVRSGIGKVNAALCAQILADLYLNSDTGGSFSFARLFEKLGFGKSEADKPKAPVSMPAAAQAATQAAAQTEAEQAEEQAEETEAAG